MIKGIYPGGRYTQVNNGTPAWPSIYNTGYVPHNASGSQSFTGQIRYNTTSGNIEIFDGSSWQGVYNSIAQVGLSQEAEQILDWAKKKMLEEFDLELRMKRHPGLKDAYDRFKVMDALTLEEGKDFGEVEAGP